jgi:ribonuclease J
MSDSTNAVRKGFTESEQHLSDIMSRIFRNAQGRIIVATFASNIHRVQTIINTAVAYGRKVALSGRSMEKVFSIAQELGYVSVPKNVIVPLDEISHVRDSKLVIVSTGSQGEPMSALSRMASGDHKNVKIKRGDTIVLSSSPIPGNETSVSDIVNRLLELNAEVVYSDIADIHVSGHACEQELKLMLTLIKPEYFMPVHGEYRHLHRHAQIAEELGIPKSKIFVADNGAVVELGKNGASITKERVPADPVFVDGLGVGDVSTMVLRDRKLLSEAGLIIAVASIDQVSGKVTTGPDILTRGFSEIEDNEALMRELREVASHKLYELEREGTLDRNAIKTALRNVIRNYVFKTTKRSPMILPILMDS